MKACLPCMVPLEYPAGQRVVQRLDRFPLGGSQSAERNISVHVVLPR